MVAIPPILEPDKPALQVTVEGEIDRASLNYQSFIQVFNLEASSLLKLDGHLNTLEEILFNDEVLLRMRRSDLIKMYSMILNRKEVAHKFMIKMAELGIKTDFLNRLTEEAKDISEIPIRPKQKVRNLVALLGKAIDMKLAE